MLKSYASWDTVLMPVHALDYAYLSFENSALPAAIELNLGIQAIKVFGKAFLLRFLVPRNVYNTLLANQVCTSQFVERVR